MDVSIDMGMTMIKRILVIVCALALMPMALVAGEKRQVPLKELQQAFVDLRFGMFVHFNMPTFCPEDWCDPDANPALFNPVKLDCSQWAKAAKSAGMTYGCLTTKHHSGFCIWNTKSTDYSVMSSPFRRDVVREFVDAFRKEGLHVMLYYSILDTHHRLRPGCIRPEHLTMIKQQLTELLTQYGDIDALIIDGWDAPWSRISYVDIPFADIYQLIKSLQPNCLVMDLNSAKYPAEGLFYSDIKAYEQGAGQKISKDVNNLPAMSCLPLQPHWWFWKDYFPTTSELKSAEYIVNENINPMGKAFCNFMLNVAPNRDGLMDANAVARLKEIGRLYVNRGHAATLGQYDDAINVPNLAIGKPVEGSWSYDCQLFDFINDDNFKTAWYAHKSVKNPNVTISLGAEQPFNAVVITDEENDDIEQYTIEYRTHNEWKTIFSGNAKDGKRVKYHRFSTVWGDAVRLTVHKYRAEMLGISELGIYNERRAE